MKRPLIVVLLPGYQQRQSCLTCVSETEVGCGALLVRTVSCFLPGGRPLVTALPAEEKRHWAEGKICLWVTRFLSSARGACPWASGLKWGGDLRGTLSPS